jgi:hypothetical protein
MINSDIVRVKNLEQAVLELGQRVKTLEKWKADQIITTLILKEKIKAKKRK